MRRVSRAVLAILFVTSLLSVAQAAEAVPLDRAAKDPDGKYEGREVPGADDIRDAVFISFVVARDGRKVKKWVVTMNVVCTTYPLSVELITQPMNPMRVNARTGKFRDLVKGATDDGTEYRVEVTGKLVGRKVKNGTLSYEVGLCQRGDDPGDPLRWKAARVGK